MTVLEKVSTAMIGVGSHDSSCELFPETQDDLVNINNLDAQDDHCIFNIQASPLTLRVLCTKSEVRLS